MNNVERSFISNIIVMGEKYNGKSMKTIFSDFRWNLKRKNDIYDVIIIVNQSNNLEKFTTYIKTSNNLEKFTTYIKN